MIISSVEFIFRRSDHWSFYVLFLSRVKPRWNQQIGLLPMYDKITVHQYSTSNWLALPLDCTENSIQELYCWMTMHNLHTTLWTSSTSACLTSTYFQYNGKNYKKVARYSYGLSCFCYCSRNCDAKYRGTSPSYLYANCTSLVKLRWRHIYICTTVNTDEIDDFHEHLRQKADIQFTKESRKMVKYLFYTAWSLSTTTD